jgi:hypothetical protein
MDVNPEEAKKAVEKGTLFGFVPHRLEIAGLSQFNNHPFNVLFQSYTIKDGKQISGTALYEPEFYTYRKDGNVSFMRYRNAYGGDCHLTIVYDEEKKLYHGEKYVNGKSVGSADGGDNWNMFFVHLTMLGLANGERCMFD